MTEPSYREDFSRGEVVQAFIWLAAFALFSAIIQVAYLDAHLGQLPVPWPVPAAFAFNLVLTKAARLWTRSRALQLAPLVAWLAGCGLGSWTVASASVGLPLSACLLVAGVAGGVWPVARG